MPSSFHYQRAQVRRQFASASWDILLPFVRGVSPVHLPAPPVPGLLHTNMRPTDEQANLVRQAIFEALEEKTNSEAQLNAKLHGKHTGSAWVAAMKHKVVRAEAFIKDHEAILSPIKRLPPEILQAILRCCAGHISSFSATCTLESVPWYLGHVCQTWRVIALQTSTLWNVIPPGPLNKSPRRSFVQMQAVGELLRRSGIAPLHVFIYCDIPQLTRHPIIDELITYSQRWKLFSFEGPAPLLLSLCPVQRRLHSLETLRLRPDGPTPVIDYFKIAPQLHTVSLTDVDVGNISLPLHQLTHYRERVVSRDLWLVALSSPDSKSPLDRLTTLDLANLTLAEPLTLPKLTRLTLRCHTHSCAGPSLPHLTLPSIKAMRISASGESLVEMLAEMVSNSAGSRRDGLCPLEDLYYRDRSSRHPPPGVLVKLLQSTPYLQTLDAPLPSPIDIHSIATHMNDLSRPLLPRLQSIKFFAQGIDCFLMENMGCIDGLSNLASAASKRSCPKVLDSINNLSIYFSQADCGAFLNHQLNGYLPTDESAFFEQTRHQLLERLAAACGESHWHIPSATLSEEDHLEKLGHTLRSIDAFQITTQNISAIYRSCLHLSLKQVADCGIDGMTEVANLSKSILAKWESTFQATLNLRQWAFRGPCELVYVPPDHPIRLSRNAMELAYELRPVPHLDTESCF